MRSRQQKRICRQVPGNEERIESLGSDASSDEEQPDGAKSMAAPESQSPVSAAGDVVVTPERSSSPEPVTTPESVKYPEIVEKARGAGAARAARTSRGAAAVDNIEVVQGIEAAEGIEFAEAGRTHKFYRAMDSIVVAKHDKPRPRDSEVVDTGMMAFCVAGGAALVLMAICTVTFVIIKMMQSLAVSRGNYSIAPANFVQPIARVGGEESYDVTFAEASVDTADYADLYTSQNTSGEAPETTPENSRLSNVLSLI
ncbi:uncharacterized protein [Dermacentor andersoni]|uniref:uncharacterized protein n=1 Tax=Dermacentor andersoni TaxID=34620 RepID=UPI002416AA7F|nr:uncharacterized protein LOC126544328 [Dermacentor andersoni]